MDIDRRVISQLAATTRFDDIRLFDEVDSTNRVVVDAARAGAGEGLVVVAGVQHAGRGRLGRRWEAPVGSALLVSLLARPRGLDPDRYHLLTAAVALAAADACAATCGLRPACKWPNDLLVGPAKLAGVLAEVAVAPTRHRPGSVVVGIGINLSASPEGATDLQAATGSAPPLDQVLAAVLRGVDARFGRWDEVAGEHRRACATLGRRVRVLAGGVTRTGTAVDLDASGRLVVAFDGAQGPAEALSAADVTHLRPGDGDHW